MSVYATAYIWEHSSQKGTPLLVLLAIGDHADKDSGQCFPGINTLARMARTTPRTVQRILPQLVKAGEVRIMPNQGPHGTHLYEVRMNRTLPLFKDPKEGGVTECHPVTKGRGGVTKDLERGDTATSPEPGTVIRTTKSNTRQVQPAKALREAATRAIIYLNVKAGTHYRATEANMKFAIARLFEGATEADLIAVVDLKIADRDFDRKYLRPETLWNATKFAGYIGQVGASAPAAQPDTQVTIFGERDDGTTVVLYTTSGAGEPDPERLARRAIDAGYVRTKFHNQPCRNIVVEWPGHRSKYALRELEQGRRA